ncbi:LysR family transcriptional regulator [Methylobacterium sp. WL19]|uniref:LysR family transcriptional regulator n=1 Tax=Methylobacterium sp. WL19 TaxID=2603896 RepID=UPI0011C9AD9B|nr:LysR family transcriptional regulator [Methylobacterium sp. WL19]TXN27665.1 LysR family transcriptional regulator [Methylobacterium sp. WL19]
MLDGLSLDQLRIFEAAVDEGSFSAAARKLRRTQSAVSETMANLEAQLGVALFDRSARYPRLTTEGAVLLADARAIVAGVNGLKARAKGIAGGLEPELTAVIDVFFPITAFAEVAREFRESFSATPLRLYVEALGATVQPVMDGRASFGLVGSLPTLPAGLTAERLTSVTFVMVAAADHPLAAHRGLIPKAALAEHVQLVLTDRSDLSAGREFGVMSPSTWRLGDLFAKHAFLLSGLGWGGMPLHIVRQDIDDGRLVILSIEDIPEGGLSLPMSAVYRTSEPPGPAGRWMIERLKQCPNQAFVEEAVDEPGNVQYRR